MNWLRIQRDVFARSVREDAESGNLPVKLFAGISYHGKCFAEIASNISLTARLVIRPLGRQTRGGFPFGTWYQQRARYRDFLGQRPAETNLVYVSEGGIKARLTGRGYGCRGRCFLFRLASDSNLAFSDGDHSKKP
jgi:hypothetical protein